MTQNPYESSAAIPTPRQGNRAGQVGLILANLSCLGIAIPGLVADFVDAGQFSRIVETVCMRIQVSFACVILPALLVSMVGLLYSPRRLAACGIGGCLVGSLLVLKLLSQS